MLENIRYKIGDYYLRKAGKHFDKYKQTGNPRQSRLGTYCYAISVMVIPYNEKLYRNALDLIYKEQELTILRKVVKELQKES